MLQELGDVVSNLGFALARRVSCLLVLATLSLSGVSFAQPNTPTPTAADLAEAERSFAQAEHAAGEGNYRLALELMQKSYEACGRQPKLLFNLGTIHRQLGHCSEALQHFEQYLERAKSGRFREEAGIAILELEQECKVPEPAKSPAADMPLPPPAENPGDAASPRSQAEPSAPAAVPRAALRVDAPVIDTAPSRTVERSIALTAFGLGAIAASTAIYFAISANQRDNDLDALLAASRRVPPLDRPSWSAQARNLSDERDADRTRAIVFGAASGVLVGAGFAALFYPTRSPSRATTAAFTLGVDLEPNRAFGRVAAEF